MRTVASKVDTKVARRARASRKAPWTHKAVSHSQVSGHDHSATQKPIPTAIARHDFYEMLSISYLASASNSRAGKSYIPK